MTLSLIWAQSVSGVIGRDGDIPWQLPEDMAHFRQLTMGHPVIMGRKTWDSLPARFRPLPGRRNIVITRQSDWSQNGVQRASSLPEALQMCEQQGGDGDGGDGGTVWIMGGAQIYAQALPLADRVEVTEIAQDFDGDAFAPVLGPEWVQAAREDQVGAGGLPFSFVRYVRRP